jgi:acetyl-CoA acyltransferase
VLPFTPRTAAEKTWSSMAFVCAAARTSFGRFNAALAGVRPDDLAATAIAGVLAQALDPAKIGEILGLREPGRRGQPQHRTDGRAGCRSSGVGACDHGQPAVRLDAAITGSSTIDTADADVVLVGGVESMTRAPWVLPKPD